LRELENAVRSEGHVVGVVEEAGIDKSRIERGRPARRGRLRRRLKTLPGADHGRRRPRGVAFTSDVHKLAACSPQRARPRATRPIRPSAAFNPRSGTARAAPFGHAALMISSLVIVATPSARRVKARACAHEMSVVPVASLIGRLRSSTFRLSATAMSMSLTGSRFSSESAPGPFHHGIRGRGGTIFRAALRCRWAGPSDQADSPHPSSREGHHSTAGWSSSFLLLGLICHGCHAAGTASLVQRNSVPSTHMRCMMTASRRAKATIAFFIPRRLAICIAQALSQDHFFDRNMLCAAS
jgi:hypothetical protein